MILSHEREAKILFYKLQSQTSGLLSTLLYSYSVEKEQLLKRHKIVLAYLRESKKDPLEVDLQAIYENINASSSAKPYNIYITDENYVIRNTSFEKDRGFDLSFAKKIFDLHYEQKIIGLSTPIFEKSSKEFLSYSDSYLSSPYQTNILQVSYTYKESRAKLLEIQELISHYLNIVDVKAYIVSNDGFVNDIILKKIPSYKPDLKEILVKIQKGKSVNERFGDRELMISHFQKDGSSYTQMYMTLNSPIVKSTKILYSILLDDSDLESSLEFLNLLMALVLILGVVALFFTIRLRKKEIKLTEQDKFVQSSMHEIKTPLSIITLNNELRELEFGQDEYSSEIESAIKTLKISYDDMSFTLTNDELFYSLETLLLEEVLQERVSYFKSIASSNHKVIELEMSGICSVEMSRVELIRLIDNNLSNAIKYSSADSTISVVLNANLLTFHNLGKPIQNKKNIFTKYVRENNIIGGHGLGLSIIKEIASKYGITIELTSTYEEGTSFSYMFKCHTSDTSVSYNNL